jgi:ketosteroid isomerase-like protein
MTIATDLLQQHFQTLVDDNAHWQTLIADDILWELAYAPSLGHPARLSGRAEVEHHVGWFVSAVQSFRFLDLRVHAFADSQSAVAEVKAEGRIKSTGRIYRQEYVVFLFAKDGKIAYLREYFDLSRRRRPWMCPFPFHLRYSSDPTLVKCTRPIVERLPALAVLTARLRL